MAQATRIVSEQKSGRPEILNQAKVFDDRTLYTRSKITD